MFGTKSFMNFFNEKTGIQFNGFWLLYRSCHILIHLTLMAMCLGFSLSFLPETANAATVYGHIYCSEDMSCPHARSQPRTDTPTRRSPV